MQGERPSLLSFAGFQMDLERGCLRKQGGDALTLRPKSFDVLQYLLENAGRLVSRDELMQTVWPNVIVTEDSITQCVMEARRALGEKGANILQTVPRRGYLLEAEVTRGAAPPAADMPGHLDIPDAVTGGGEGALVPALPDRPSLVVLPFANLSGDAEQDYFADGMTEELTTALIRIRWFFVIARNSAFTYKGRMVDVRQVGRELGVRYVLEGSVRKAGGRVRISTQLVEAQTAHHLWAERFDGTLEDIFDLQDRVAEAVAGVIEPNLRAAEIGRSATKPTGSLDAYDLYLRALPQSYSNTRVGSDAALDLLHRAITLDPDFALAKALIAFVHVMRRSQVWSGPPEWAEGTRLAREALAAASEDPSALRLAGHAVALLAPDIEAGLMAVERALALNPNSAQVLSAAAWVHNYACRPEVSIPLFTRAMRLSPLDPELAYMMSGIGMAQLIAGDPAAAIPWGERSVRQAPTWMVGHRVLIAGLMLSGRVAEAKAAAAAFQRLTPQTRKLEAFVAIWCRRDFAERYIAALRAAGLPG
jgi:TolB-like protein/DNA-binding winged helix-turn-helix (wHTH) protein/Tfp pilus assembly protein PilF